MRLKIKFWEKRRISMFKHEEVELEAFVINFCSETKYSGERVYYAYESGELGSCNINNILDSWWVKNDALEEKQE